MHYFRRGSLKSRLFYKFKRKKEPPDPPEQEFGQLRKGSNLQDKKASRCTGKSEPTRENLEARQQRRGQGGKTGLPSAISEPLARRGSSTPSSSNTGLPLAISEPLARRGSSSTPSSAKIPPLVIKPLSKEPRVRRDPLVSLVDQAGKGNDADGLAVAAADVMTSQVGLRGDESIAQHPIYAQPKKQTKVRIKSSQEELTPVPPKRKNSKERLLEVGNASDKGLLGQFDQAGVAKHAGVAEQAGFEGQAGKAEQSGQAGFAGKDGKAEQAVAKAHSRPTELDIQRETFTQPQLYSPHLLPPVINSSQQLHSQTSVNARNVQQPSTSAAVSKDHAAVIKDNATVDQERAAVIPAPTSSTMPVQVLSSPSPSNASTSTTCIGSPPSKEVEVRLRCRGERSTNGTEPGTRRRTNLKLVVLSGPTKLTFSLKPLVVQLIVLDFTWPLSKSELKTKTIIFL